jgi:hypothetical protein
MVETSPTMYNLCFYDVGNILVHVWYSPADSFVLEIQTDDVYHDIIDNFLNNFDLSNYSNNHPIFYNKVEVKGIKTKNQGV